MNTRYLSYLVGIIGLLISGCLRAQTVPTPDHVVVLVLENHGFSEIIGSPAAPYINSLAADSFGALFTNSHGVTHPSQPNYMYLFSGDNQNVILDFTPLSLLLPFTTDNLGAELLQNGRTFTGYSEDLPYVGYTGDNSGQYYRKHNPWVNWQDGTTNGIPAALNQSFTSFPTVYSNLPTVSFVIPNQDHDMHDGTIAQADAWIQANLDAYIQWAKTHNSLLILTFDEDENLTGSNDIATIFVGQMVKHGQYSENIDHNRVLRTIEDMYNLPYAGNSAGSTPIVDCWVYKPVSKLGANPIQLCPGQMVSFIDSTLNEPTATHWSFEGGNPASSSASSPVVMYDSAGVYKVTLVSSNQMGSDTLVKLAYITVHPIPVVLPSADTLSICKGDTAIISASGAAFYNWLPAQGLFYSLGNSMKANPTVNTSYNVIGLLNGCVSDTVSILVTVDSVQIPTLSVTPNVDTTVCNGSTVLFHASVTHGGNNPYYLWKLNGNTTATHTADFGTIALGNNYTVACVLTSSAACAVPKTLTGNTIQITVEQTPHPVISVVDSVLSSTTAATYQWYLNGQVIDGANAQTYIASETGTYVVEGITSAGCSGFSDPVQVNLSLSGTAQRVENEALSLYPNPNSGEFFIQSSTLEVGECYITLTDMSGRKIFAGTYNAVSRSEKISMNIGSVEPGAYILTLVQKGKQSSSKIFMQ